MKVTTQQYINGTNVKDLDKSDCIGIIRAAEADIATLEGVQTESKAVTAEIAGIRSFIDEVVEVLDAKK